MFFLLFSDQYNTNNKETLTEEMQWDIVTQIWKQNWQLRMSQINLKRRMIKPYDLN